MIELTFLGTTAGIPTRERGHSALALRYGGEIILFDCGENTQRQMLFAGLSPMKVDKIFLTHWHADHFAGLPGLMQSLSLRDRKAPLYIYGPKGTKKFITTLLGIGYFNLTYKIISKDIRGKEIVSAEKDYTVYSCPVAHNVETLAYKFLELDKPGRFDAKKAKELGVDKQDFSALQRGKPIKTAKGKVKPEQVMGPERRGLSVVYSGDTGYSADLVEFSEEADLLIHEATFSHDLRSKAIGVLHSTTKSAAEVALKAGVKRLILTHISARYTEPSILLKEAKKVFPNTEIAEDLMSVKLK